LRAAVMVLKLVRNPAKKTTSLHWTVTRLYAVVATAIQPPLDFRASNGRRTELARRSTPRHIFYYIIFSLMIEFELKLYNLLNKIGIGN